MLVVRLDEDPWRVRGARALDHVGGRHLVFVPFVAVAPILARDLEALEARLLALLEAAQLLLFRDLQPVLGDDGAVARELLLERVDLRVGAQPVGLAAEALDALDEDPPVPTAVVDREPPFARNVPPEAPEIGLRPLFFGRGCDGNRVVEAGRHRHGGGAGRAPPSPPPPFLPHANHPWGAGSPV